MGSPVSRSNSVDFPVLSWNEAPYGHTTSLYILRNTQKTRKDSVYHSFSVIYIYVIMCMYIYIHIHIMYYVSISFLEVFKKNRSVSQKCPNMMAVEAAGPIRFIVGSHLAI